jgi:cell wall-associated NlpC family hydrolase
VSARPSTSSTRSAAIVIVAMLAGVMSVGVGVAVLVVLFGQQNGDCGTSASGGAGSIALGPPGSGQLVGATEYGGPGDPSSGTLGARGDNLLSHPDTYAELGGLTWQTASAMGGLGYMTPLRVTWGPHSAVAYKRDFGLGGGPIAGLPRVIDLWWQFAERLGIPYENGMWSGPVRVSRPPDPGAASVLGQTAPAATATGGALLGPSAGATSAAACTPASHAGLPLTPGERARLLPNGQAAAPRSAPAAIKEIIAAGNQIVGKPYVYGGAHGLPLSNVEPGYDCSSSVEHLLYGARLVPVTYGAASSTLEVFGAPGPGHWVTLYASADHVFMYVAGLRWDTHDAAWPGDGSGGIGWHPLVRSAAGFVARHPVGL